MWAAGVMVALALGAAGPATQKSRAPVPKPRPVAPAPDPEDLLPAARSLPRPPAVLRAIGSPSVRRKAAADYPAAARAAGQHGMVTVAGTVSAEGRLVDAHVTVSSRAPLLDAAALAAANASTFVAARGAQGEPIAGSISMDFSFLPYSPVEEGGEGLRAYRCAAFLRDQAWWAATWPGEDDDLYLLMRLVGGGEARGRESLAAMQRRYKAFEQRWPKVIAACRAAPDALFADMIKPEGDMVRALRAW